MDIYEVTFGNTYDDMESFELESNEILESEEEAFTVETEESDFTAELPDSFIESQAGLETDFKEEALENVPISEEMASLEETFSLEETASLEETSLIEEETASAFEKEEESQEEVSSQTSTETSESALADERNQMDLFLVSQDDRDSSLEWQDNLASCNSYLSSCVPLLLFGDILLCLLLGCLCTSIFSRFWKVNR